MGLESILRATYSGKKIFITGHTGFKGSWLLAIFHFLNANVKGYSLKPAQKSMYHLIDGNKMCQSIEADILHEEQLENEIKIFKPDYIFHLAAQSLVRKSYEFPINTFDVNVIGTAKILN